MLDSPQDSPEVRRAAVPAQPRDVMSAPFCCTCSHLGIEAAWVKAFGDLDLAGVPELDAALCEGLASAQLVVLDLSHLSFIDLVAVRTIVDASVRAVCDGRRLMIAFAPAHVRRTFTLTGTAEAIEMLDLHTTGAPAETHLRLVESGRGA